MTDRIGRRAVSRRSFSMGLAVGALVAGFDPLTRSWATASGTTADEGFEEEREGGSAMTVTHDHELAETIEEVRHALAAMGSGDPQPYIDTWAASPDVTLFGAWGPIERGHQELVDTFRWVGSRFTGGALVPEDLVTYTSGDLAYTVGFERGEVSVDGGPMRPMTIRVTHLYRRIDGAWRLVHRHADFPPADQRLGTR